MVVAEGLGAKQQRGKADQKNADENLRAPPCGPSASTALVAHTVRTYVRTYVGSEHPAPTLPIVYH